MTNKNLLALAGVAGLSLAAAAKAQTLELIAGAGRYVDAPATTVPVAPSSIPFMDFGPDGKLYVVDYNSRFVRFDPATGTATALPANNASVNFKFQNSVYGMAFDANGNLHVTTNGLLRILDPDGGTITTLPGFFPAGDQMVFAADGTLYSVGGSRVYARTATNGYVTVAGDGLAGFSGDGGPATAAQLDTASSIAVGPNGDLFVADSGNHRIRRISLATGVITTVVGTGDIGFNGDGLDATATNIYHPRGLALDAGGNIYFGSGHRIRRVDAATNTVSTVVGTGAYGNAGNGGPGTAATMTPPRTLVLDAAGNVYFDGEGLSPGNGARQVRRLDVATGIVTHVLGGPDDWFCGDNVPARAACFMQPSGIDIDANQNVYVSTFGTRRLLRYSPQTGLVAVVAFVPYPSHLMAMEHDASGQIHAVSWGGYQIDRVNPTTGVITRVAGTGNYGFGGDGGPALNASISTASDVELDAAGNLYIADTANNRIRRVDAATQIMTTYLQMPSPGAIEFDGTGQLVVAGGGYCGLRRLDPTTLAFSTIVGTGICPSTPPTGGALATATNIPNGTTFTWDPAGNLYLIWSAGILYRVDAATGILDRVPQPPNGLETHDGVRITDARKMEFDAAGTLYIVDYRGYLFRVTGLAGTDGTPPAITPAVSGTLGNEGWYTSAVQVAWTVADAQSTVSSTEGCSSITQELDTAGETFTCTATSEGGTSSHSVTIKKDGNPPYAVWGPPIPAPNGRGWSNSNVTFTYTLHDTHSGVWFGSPASPVTVTHEGISSTTSIFVRDLAGNYNTISSPGADIDRTPPSIVLVSPEANRLYGAFTTMNVGYACPDNLSTMPDCVGTAPFGAPIPASTPGAKSFTVTATDAAGNTATLTRPYSVAALQFERFIEPLRRSPTFNGVTAGSLVPIRWRMLDGTGQFVTNPAAFQSFTALNLACQGTAIPLNDTATGAAGLSVNPANGYFTYNWQTDPSWAGTCKRVQIRFGDNSVKEVVFRF